MLMEPTIREFAKLKALGDRTFAQLDERELNASLAPGANSIAVLVRHLHGNMRSRWTDFLTSDGEKPDRHRDREFDEAPLARSEMLRLWEEGWTILFNALNVLSDADLTRTVTIRREPHTVVQAILRQLAHYGGHVHQIVMIGKCLRGDAWQTLSIPRGASEAFNAKMSTSFGSTAHTEAPGMAQLQPPTA